MSDTPSKPVKTHTHSDGPLNIPSGGRVEPSLSLLQTSMPASFAVPATQYCQEVSSLSIPIIRMYLFSFFLFKICQYAFDSYSVTFDHFYLSSTYSSFQDSFDACLCLLSSRCSGLLCWRVICCKVVRSLIQIQVNKIQFPSLNLRVANDMVLRKNSDTCFFFFCNGIKNIGMHLELEPKTREHSLSIIDGKTVPSSVYICQTQSSDHELTLPQQTDGTQRHSNNMGVPHCSSANHLTATSATANYCRTILHSFN